MVARLSLFSLAARAIDRSGVRRSRAGRSLIAALNVVGRCGARLFFGNRAIVVDGHKMFLAGRNAPSLGYASSMRRECYEPEMKTLLAGLIRKGMTVVDIGAHVGHYALMTARLVGPGGRVYAFEPDPDNFAILVRNVELNGYTNVTCIRKAVSNRTGPLTFYVSRQGNDRHGIVRNPGEPENSEKRVVTGTTLDEFAASAGWPRVDVIKMDVEGAEPLALAGMSGLLKRCDGTSLVLEFAPALLRAGGIEPADFLQALTGMGFAVTAVEPGLPQDPRESSALAEIHRRGAINLLCTKSAVCPAARSQVATNAQETRLTFGKTVCESCTRR